MFPARDDFYRVLPEIVLCLFGIALMLAEPLLTRARRTVLLPIAIFGAASALFTCFYSARHQGLAFSGLLSVDAFSVFIHVLVGVVALLTVLGSADYLDREDIQEGEYYALIFFATAGMGVMASAAELITAFIALEVSSLSTYILASYRRNSPKSNEAALKYFLLGSFATAFLLYGIALAYGATRTTQLLRMSAADVQGAPTLLRIGLALMLVGLGFKIAIAPFQIWAPDVYEGAPAPVSALLSSGPKVAAFALLVRILATVTAAGSLWFWAFWVSATLTMFLGNLGALAQTNVKRMLAYSSIAHAGYVLVALAGAAVSEDRTLAIAAVLYYLATYALMKFGAFVLIAQAGGKGERNLDIEQFAGLSSRQPLLAACFSVFLLSLLGLPVTAGFLGKFYVFNAALTSHLVLLAVLVAVNSIIGAVYYLRVIVAMYMREPRQDVIPVRIHWAAASVLLFTAAGTIYLGLFPGRVMDFATRAAMSLPATASQPVGTANAPDAGAK